MPITQTIWNYFDSAASSGGGITGSGTPPQVAYFSGANAISSTPHAEHRTNDFYINSVAFHARGSTVSTNITVTDIYVGGLFRAVPITFTLPALASVEDGHLYILGDETGQGAVLPVSIAAQAGEIIREGGFNNASISTFLPHQFYKLIKRPTYYMVIGD